MVESFWCIIQLCSPSEGRSRAPEPAAASLCFTSWLWKHSSPLWNAAPGPRVEESWFLWQVASWLVKLENAEGALHDFTSSSEQVCSPLPGKSEPGFPGNKLSLALARLYGLQAAQR